MSRILVTGSLAYDYIMHFSGVFSQHILPEKLDILNVSFTANNMSKNYGGTGGNIAYCLNLLKEDFVLFATTGGDFHDYSQRFLSLGISNDDIVVHESQLTASAHIITDQNSNQITAFHGGAMLDNDISVLPLLEKHDISWAIIAANGKFGMLRYAKEFTEKGIPYIYDPGHSIPAFEGDEILQLMKDAHVVIVNKYEQELICDKTGKSLEEMIAEIPYFIVTQGKDGSYIYHQGETHKIAVTKPNKEVFDPTGAGDAYRGGLLKALLHKLNPQQMGQLASLSACYAVEHQGTQNYSFSQEDFIARYVENYGEDDFLRELFV